MIPNECIYGLIGAVLAWLGARFGIPFLSSKTSASNLSDTVRMVLLDILKGLNAPVVDPNAELKQHLSTFADKKSN